MNSYLNRSNILWMPSLAENDILNDCTVAALVNSARAAMWVQKGCDLAVDTDAVVAWFARVGGVAPTLSAERSVVGFDPPTVLDYAIRNGFSAGLQAPLALATAVIAAASPQGLCDAMRPGAAYVEIGLTAADMTGAEAWDLPAGNITARHQIIAWECSGTDLTDEVQIGTWGRWQYVTWRGLLARLCAAWKLEWRLP